MEQEFKITFTCTNTVRAEHIWPDGDAPAHPTTDDVAAVMERSARNPEELYEAWNLGGSGENNITIEATTYQRTKAFS